MAERAYSGYGAILFTEQVMAKNLLSKDAGRAVKAEVGRRPMWMDGESEGEVGWDGIGRRQESDACFPIWLFLFKMEVYILAKNKLFSLRMGTGKVLLYVVFSLIWFSVLRLVSRMVILCGWHLFWWVGAHAIHIVTEFENHSFHLIFD